MSLVRARLDKARASLYDARMKIINTGLYGANGHQVFGLLAANPRAVCRGFAGFPRERLPEPLRSNPAVRDYGSLDAMLADPELQLVSLCSPRRDAQAADAVRCLEAGKHVYAEKPCALNEADLDAILKTAAAHGVKFHEMTGSAFDQPYREMRRLVRSGVLGEIVQVWAQKSYPWYDTRPQDEGLDGGLLRQAGVHAVRFVEHTTGLEATTVSAMETRLGNAVPGGECRRAAQISMRLSNGGLACVIVNYLNLKGFGSWGNEHLRIFGTEGFVESVDAAARTRLILKDQDCGPLKPAEPPLEWFECFLDELTGTGDGFPITQEEEFHPTRVVIRAKEAVL
jgi:predicted dehydrogenase